MDPRLRIRVMSPTDLAFADSLRELAGWNQTLEDWRRFLAMQPGGCFVAEWDGVPSGTATTAVYGSDLAWIGMVLVHPEYRRRGIGRGLLLKCIDYVQARGVRCIKLDATPQGKPVYQNLGFKDEWTVRRWECDLSTLAPVACDSRIHVWAETHAPALDLLDTGAFGVSRRELMLALSRQSRCFLTFEGASGDPTGCGMLREGARADYLGPISATSPEAGLALIECLTVSRRSGRLFWDIPDQNTAAIKWAACHGFTVQRSLTRMWLGENRTPGDPLQQFALAGPELG